MAIATLIKEAGRNNRLIYLPPIIVRMALGAQAQKVDGNDVHVSLNGEDPLAMVEEDFVLAAKIAARLRPTLAPRLDAGGIIDTVGEAHRLLSEELFRAGAVRILYFPMHAAGSLFYRCILPTVAMNAGTRAQAFVSKNRVAREAADFDVVVFQIDHSPIMLQLVKQLQAMGKKCVFEIDDAFDAMEDWHAFSDQYKRQEEINQVLEMMKTCDAVTVSTKWLGERYGKYAKRIEVIPNMMPVNDWFQAERPARAQHMLRLPSFRVLWAGSPSHWGDLKVVGEALSLFARRHSDVKLVFFGREPVGLDVPREQVEVHEFVDFSVYPQKLAEMDADVAIAPIADVPFNYAKSNVKILEYWATGYPVVASSVGPYLDTIKNWVNGALCVTENDWVESLDALYGNKGLRNDLRRAGLEAVQAFNIDKLTSKVEDFFLSLAKG